MRWRHLRDRHGELDESRAESDSDYKVLKDAPDSFMCWGPPGSQDVSYIQANTAHHIRNLWREDMENDKVQCVAGRGFIGIFTSPDEARDACESHAAQVSRGTSA